MRRVTRQDVRRLLQEEAIREERRRLDEAWLEILGDVGMAVLKTAGGRKVAAQTLRGLASLAVLPTKVDDAVMGKVDDKSGVARKSVAALNQAVSLLSGGLVAAKGLQALADWLEGLDDAGAASVQRAAQAVAGQVKGAM